MLHSYFTKYRRIEVHKNEQYAANSVRINTTILIPKGPPNTPVVVQQLDYEIKEIALSEFQKIEGCLSCLYLRF
ncbi:MAG: dimethylargininase [Glaciecola sp.]|jgi:dimethylargininase